MKLFLIENTKNDDNKIVKIKTILAGLFNKFGNRP